MRPLSPIQYFIPEPKPLTAHCANCGKAGFERRGAWLCHGCINGGVKEGLEELRFEYLDRYQDEGR